MKRLVNQFLDISNEKNNKIEIKSVLADRAYYLNINFRCLEEKKIKSGIKIRSNSVVSSKNNRLRIKEVRQQTKDLLKWKKKRMYGSRWMAETAFSSINQMFDEYASAIKFENMVKEMTMKISLYNLFRRIV